MRRHDAMYAASRNTTNSSDKKKRMYAIPGNIVYVWRTIDPSYQQTQCIVRHIRKYKKYAHQEIQGVRNTRNCYVALTNSIYATSGETIYWTPHQEINSLRHIKIYSIYAITGIAMHVWRTIYTPHREIQYIVSHIRKYKEYVTSGNTGCTPYQ